MKSKDTQLLEEAYHMVRKNASNSFRWIEAGPGVEVTNRTYNVQGKDVLVKRTKDQDEESEWFHFSLIDPETKQPVFRDMTEEEISALLRE